MNWARIRNSTWFNLVGIIAGIAMVTAPLWFLIFR